ncbi:ATP-grasp domain-containing protein [Halodesulfurarchaeum formicicum]|uniref:RimK domain protein ATP-grasp n=1 Tax=Halodesulfurarchaeum formicicum TaxID=1873524 RepID=A0A1J1AAE9_9EURY|nr:RimK family alpha-L-glutamate ligase [Halodesulfurarchaeum formicicum]APE94703.1 RimK domain protein ATP-grasp [Halodesulfurarchaeum formicicum]
MLTLGIAHKAETAARIREPLAARDIDVEHVSLTGDTTALSSDVAHDLDIGLVFPSRLMEGGLLTARLDIPWVNDRTAVLRSRNKAETLARLDAAGLPVPETVFVSDPVSDADLRSAADKFEPPIVIKPNSATRGEGILKVTEWDSLLGVTDYLDLLHQFPATRDRSYLLQEYLPAARDIRVMVIDGQVVGAVERTLPESAREAGHWKHNVHRGAEATAIEPRESIRELAEAAAAAMDISLLGVDILETDSRTVISETNARPTIDVAEKYDERFYDVLAATIRATAR